MNEKRNRIKKEEKVEMVKIVNVEVGSTFFTSDDQILDQY
jgi:hypothetical protein